MSRLFRSGHQLQFIIGAEVRHVLQLKQRPKEYTYVFIIAFAQRGYVGIMSPEDGQIVGYFDTTTVTSFTEIPYRQTPWTTVKTLTVELMYYSKAAAMCRSSLKALLNSVDTTQLKLADLYAKVITLVDTIIPANEQAIAKHKQNQQIVNEQQVEKFANNLFKLTDNTLQDKFVHNLCLFEFALYYMSTPKLKLNYRVVGELVPYIPGVHEHLYPLNLEPLTPCEILFPACVDIDHSEMMFEPTMMQGYYELSRMIVLSRPDNVLRASPPTVPPKANETEDDIKAFLRKLYMQKWPDPPRSYRFPRRYVDPVSFRDYVQNACTIDVVAKESTKIHFYPLVPHKEFDLIFPVYKPFGSLLCSFECQFREEHVRFVFTYLAEKHLYTNAELKYVADEMQRILVRMITESPYCYKYNSDKRHSVIGCDDCSTVKKRNRAIISQINNYLSERDDFLVRPGTFKDRMEYYFQNP